MDYALNWKSLAQPAILPLNTDYLPQINDLKTSYEVNNTYQLILDPASHFTTPEDMLKELICQRLSQVFFIIIILYSCYNNIFQFQEFQLIKGPDLTPYKNFLHGGKNSSSK